MAKLEQIGGGVLAFWVHRVVLRCKYDENLDIIPVFHFFRGALTPPNQYIGSLLPKPKRDKKKVTDHVLRWDA